MEKEQRRFRRQAFGGFNKEDVMDYIENMKREFAEYKQQVEDTMEALHEQIPGAGEASEGASSFEDPAFADGAFPSVGSIAAATERLKEVGDFLCENLNALIDRLQNAPAAAEGEDAVSSILSGLLNGQGNASVPEKPGFSKDADLVESVLPAYLR